MPSGHDHLMLQLLFALILTTTASALLHALPERARTLTLTVRGRPRHVTLSTRMLAAALTTGMLVLVVMLGVEVAFSWPSL